MFRSPAHGAIVALLLLACGCASPPRARDEAPRSIQVSRPVRIVTDRWGIPHLRAENLADLYFAWGWVSARDRLWQMMSQRQAAHGQLWRWLGNSTLRADGGAQLFELRARAERVWERARLDSAAAAALEGYAAGVNAYLARRRASGRWPAEFEALGVRPEDWRPPDTVALLFGEGVLLDLDLPEIAEAEAIATQGPGWIEHRRRFESQWIYDTIPDSAAARLYGPRAAERTAGAAPPAEPAAAVAGSAAWGLGDPRPREEGASDVFAVGPRRSASGYPLFANDVHLPMSIPGPFHAIHLSVPGVVDAIGFYVPGIPSLVSGRNRRCAWGISALSGDVVDVYADTLSADGRSVKTPEGWVPLREAGYDLRFRWLGLPLPALGQVRRYTPHGPVVVYDKKRRLALSVRWTALEDSIAIGPLLGVERSSTAAEVCAHFRPLVVPCLNLIAADRDGRVVYQVSGSVPRRNFEPVPGVLPSDGRHEWRGFLAHDALPAWQAPPGGYVVNCNNRPVGPVYPEAFPRYDWAQDRALQVDARLAALKRVTLDDLRGAQNDIYSRGAERHLPRLLACADSMPDRWTPRMRQALDTLRNWNLTAARPLVGPTLFRGWYGALQRRSRLEGLQGLTAAALEGRAPDALAQSPAGRNQGIGQVERPAEAAIAALALALDTLAAKLGPDLSDWTWARAHRAVFRSELAGRRGQWQPEPTPADGDNSTPCAGASRLPWSTSFAHAPVFRHLVDLANPDSSLGVLPPGNSGVRESPHLLDQLALWANHDYVPFYLSWERIETVKGSETTLTPP